LPSATASSSQGRQHLFRAGGAVAAKAEIDDDQIRHLCRKRRLQGGKTADLGGVDAELLQREADGAADPRVVVHDKARGAQPVCCARLHFGVEHTDCFCNLVHPVGSLHVMRASWLANLNKQFPRAVCARTGS
jgi:hypothetical protein